METTATKLPDRDPIELRYNRPWTFYLLATAIPWALWFPAAWLSHQGTQWGWAVALLGIAGLVSPMGVVWWLTRHDPEIRRDIARRVVNFRDVHPVWVALSIGLIPAGVLIATALSVAFGYSSDQFLLRGAVTFSAGVLPGWVVLVLAPIVEELAWHSYGVDSLRTRYSVFTASMVFGLIWAVWHLPLAFIAGSSQSDTVEQGWIHAVNFPVSVVPLILLMNWIYFRTGRNITLTAVFHLSANLITQVLATHPDTEVMATGVLLVITAGVLWADRDLFFTRALRPSVPARHHAQ